jgi:hypothetical protein
MRDFFFIHTVHEIRQKSLESCEREKNCQQMPMHVESRILPHLGVLHRQNLRALFNSLFTHKEFQDALAIVPARDGHAAYILLHPHDLSDFKSLSWEPFDQ